MASALVQPWEWNIQFIYRASSETFVGSHFSMSQVKCKLWCSYVDVFHLVLEDAAQEVLAEFSSFFMKMTSTTCHRLSVSACFTCLGIRHCCCGWCCLDCSCLKTSLAPHPMPGQHICTWYHVWKQSQTNRDLFFWQDIQEIYILAVARQICFFEVKKEDPNPLVHISSPEAVSINVRSRNVIDMAVNWRTPLHWRTWSYCRSQTLRLLHDFPYLRCKNWSQTSECCRLFPATVHPFRFLATGYPVLGPRLSELVRKQGSANDWGKYLAPGYKKLPNVLLSFVLQKPFVQSASVKCNFLRLLPCCQQLCFSGK